jgi:hypothetical protein
MFIEICTFDIDVCEGVDAWVRYEGVRNRCESDLLVFIEGKMGTVWIRPTAHNL